MSKTTEGARRGYDVGMTWGELAKMLGFRPEDQHGGYPSDEFEPYGGPWMKFRQWAGYSWDSDKIDPDGPVSTDKALQLLMQRLVELEVLKEKE